MNATVLNKQSEVTAASTITGGSATTSLFDSNTVIESSVSSATTDMSTTNTKMGSTATDTAYTPAALESQSNNLTQSNVKFTTVSSTASTKSNPCSNDNPDWEEGTQPCPNSITDYIFDGAVTTVATTTTAEESIDNTSQVRLPSSYSCKVFNSPSDSETASEAAAMGGAIYLRFNYELYTTPNQTATQIKSILSDFELQLGYAVAHAVGLTNCLEDDSDNLGSNGNDEGTAAKKRLRHRQYNRRSLQRTLMEDSYEFLEISIEPLDVIDTTLLDCTLEVTLQTPSVCTPIHGFMTAQLAPVESSKRQRYLGKQYRESTPEQYLLSTVESYMVNNQSAYLTDELLHVAYIGERDLKIGNIDPEVLARPIANSADAEEAYPGSKYVGISVAGIFIAVLLVGLIYSYREDRQKRKAEEVEMDMEDDDVEVVDVEESKDVLEECDGAFPVMDNMNSMVASDGGSVQESPAKLLLNESSMSNESSIPPPLDPNVPTDNLFGLKGKISSDASMVQSKEDSDDGSAGIDVFDVPQNDDDESTESQPMESMSIVEDPRDEDSVESSANSEDVDSASQESDDTPNVANDPNWAGIVNNEPSDAETTPLDVNLSPSRLPKR